MSGFLLIILLPITFAVILLFSKVFGDAFRFWNNGPKHEDKSKLDKLVTLLIGLIIVVLVMFFLIK